MNRLEAALALDRAGRLVEAYGGDDAEEIQRAERHLEQVVGIDQVPRWHLAAALLRFLHESISLADLRRRYTERYHEVVGAKELLDRSAALVVRRAVDLTQEEIEAARSLAVELLSDDERLVGGVRHGRGFPPAVPDIDGDGIPDIVQEPADRIAAWLDVLTHATRTLCAEELGTLWDELGRESEARAYLAVWAMAACGSESVAFLRTQLLKPPLDDDRITALISKLGHEDYGVRERAMNALYRAVDRASSALGVAARESKSLEVKARVRRLLRELKLGPLDRWANRQKARAVQVLYRIGTDEAHLLLGQIGAPAPPKPREPDQY